MTLLQIVQQACREMALPVPNQVASATDQQTLQMYGLINAFGQELLDAGDFQVLIEEHTFSTTGTGTANLPSDFHRPLDATQWDRSNHWGLQGPIPPMGWQWLKSSQLASNFRVRFRIRGGTFEYHPSTDTGHTFAYEYIKKNWVVDDDGSTEKSAFDGDSDTCVFRDRLMINGLKWKFMEAKGFDATTYLRDVVAQIEAQLNDSGAPVLSLSGGSDVHLVDYSNVPETGLG